MVARIQTGFPVICVANPKKGSMTCGSIRSYELLDEMQIFLFWLGGMRKLDTATNGITFLEEPSRTRRLRIRARSRIYVG